MNRNKILVFILAALLLCCALPAMAGNKKLMTIEMAKQDLKRNLMESVVGYKVKKEGEFGLTEDPNLKVDSKAHALIKGVQVDECVYDPGKDIAICYGHMDLADVINVLGEYNYYQNVTIKHVGLGTTNPAARPALQALRAAMLDAYQQLAALLVGEEIYSRSQVENFILTKDVNRSRLCAAVYGAYIPQHSVKFGKKGWGWDAEGDAYVILQLDVEKVRDVMGNILIYQGENIVEVMGMGTSKDELSESDDQAGALKGGSTKVSYGDLAVPTEAAPPAADSDYKGGAAAQ